jgi:Uma2 family endonuclease
MSIVSALSLEQFLALPETDIIYELKEGQAVPKMSPKFFHSHIQKTLLFLLDQWSENRGRVEPEWAITLKRNGNDWVPVPDLTYVSFQRLPADWMKDEPCPVAPELVIEIISPGQSFGDLAEKAADYLNAGVSRVWIIDTQARSITVFYPTNPPQTLRKTLPITDSLLEELRLTPQEVFQKAGFSD